MLPQFTFRYEPGKSLYKIYTILSILFVRLPFWCIKFTVPSWRPHPKWDYKRSVTLTAIREYVSFYFTTDLPLPPAPDEENGFVWVDPTPELITGHIKDLAAVNGVIASATGGYWYGKAGADGKVGQKATPDERIVMHLHGGGYIVGTAHPAGLTAPILTGLIASTPQVSRVFAPEYRLSSAAPYTPANPFPAALIDTLACYHYLLTTVGAAPHQIIISGDSAGANLVLALVRYLGRAKLPAVPPPGGLLLQTPTNDWSNTHATGSDCSFHRNLASDYAGPWYQGYSARALRGYIPPDDLEAEWWISPGSHILSNVEIGPSTFEGLPPIFIVVGGAEMALDSVRVLRERLAKSVSEERITYLEQETATHDHLTLAWFEPERTHMLLEIGKWVESL